MFKDVIGHTRIKESFTRAIKSAKLHHAYLFAGPMGVGKEALAIEVMKLINCRNRKAAESYCGFCSSCKELEVLNSSENLLYIFPDIIKKSDSDKIIREKYHLIKEDLVKKGKLKGYLKFSFKSGKFITINQIKLIKTFLQYNAYQGTHKFIIIDEAEKMNKEAANSLLKILEEPPNKVHFFLITSKIDYLLPTIISRCQVFPFSKLANSDVCLFFEKNFPQKYQEIKDSISLANGSIGEMLNFALGKMDLILEGKSLFLEILTQNNYAQAIDKIDYFTEMKKEISDNDLESILILALNSIIENRFKKNYTNSNLLKIEKLDKKFKEFIYMVKRNINFRLLLLGMYSFYDKEIRK